MGRAFDENPGATGSTAVPSPVVRRPAVDGSIYLESAHNLVDLSALSFGRITNCDIDATFTITILFELEGSSFQNRDATLTTPIRLPHELVSGRKGT